MDIENVLLQLTLEEKASLCAGSDNWHTQAINRLGIPSVLMADGPHGLRMEVADGTGNILRDSYPATCFPTASALASTWNRDLVARVGSAIGEECLAEGVSVVLGPGANIKRSPLCGRNFEYYSEDPFLTGEMAAAFIQGVQQMGVGTSLKHFAANNQEYRRMLIDSIVDERALHEIYLAGFEIAVKKGKPWTVMAAYNRLNGVYCTENSWLLEDLLRKEWGFKGLVVSDWGAVNDRVLGILAGMDLEMPGVDNGNQELIQEAVEKGELAENTLDAAIRRLLQCIDRSQSNLKSGFICDMDGHHQLAMDTAAEAAVLLKNDGILPIRKDATIALIGQFAKKPRYQGSGSSLINPFKLDTLYDAMCAYAGPDKIIYADGYSFGENENAETLLDAAITAAKKADVAVVCVGLTDMDEIESLDRKHLKLPASQDRLIDTIATINPNLVVLLSNGAPVVMPWVEKVPAILEGYLGGQAGAGAHCKLLYGEEIPSGKLAETFPVSLQETPSYKHFPGGPSTVEYRESIYVGYRFYDTFEKEVLYPFGHGLSYTTFAYDRLQVQPGKEGEVEVTFEVRNSGDRFGKEVAQVYVHPQRPEKFRPEQELKQFAKIALQPGERKAVQFTLDRRAFAYYSIERHDWIVEEGDYQIRIGSSSRDIRLSATIAVSGEKSISESQQRMFHSKFPDDARVSQAAFAQILDFPIPENRSNPKPYTLNTPVIDMQGSMVGRNLQKIIRKQIDDLVDETMHGPTRLMIEQMALESPLRVLVMFSNGGLNRQLLDGLLMVANGQIFKGLFQLLISFI